MVFRFGTFQLDVAERRLLCAGEVIPLRAKIFDTLCILVENHGRLIRKDELMRRLWPDSFVDENNLDHNISKLRRVLAEGKNGAKYIETVPRQGYRFVADVESLNGSRLTVPIVEREGEPEPPPIQQKIKFFTAHDNARIAYAVAGEGPVLVKAANWLNHLDFELKSPIWKHWLPVLTEHHKVVRYDERGNGLSSWNITDFSFESWLRDFERLIDELKLKRFSLLGISQGAAVAVWYAAKYPERVEKMVLHGSFARGWMKRPIPHEIEKRNAFLTIARLGWGKDTRRSGRCLPRSTCRMRCPSIRLGGTNCSAFALLPRMRCN